MLNWKRKTPDKYIVRSVTDGNTNASSQDNTKSTTIGEDVVQTEEINKDTNNVTCHDISVMLDWTAFIFFNFMNTFTVVIFFCVTAI